MSDLAKMLRREQHRHLAISAGLLSMAVISATMVTNERGVFSTIFTGGPLSALERAFAAIPDAGTPVLFHRVAPANRRPFAAPARPADFGRRLADAIGPEGTPLTPDILNQQITPDQLAFNDVPSLPGAEGVSDVPQSLPPQGPVLSDTPVPGAGAVPEPAVWALLIGGFGLVGMLQRRGRDLRQRAAFLRGE